MATSRHCRASPSISRSIIARARPRPRQSRATTIMLRVAGRPERRRHGGADQPVAVEGGDPAAEAEDQRPVLRPVRPALGAGERDGGRRDGRASTDRRSRSWSSRLSGTSWLGAILAEAAAQVLCRAGLAAQSCVVLPANSPQEMPRRPARLPRATKGWEAPPATSCRRARAIRRFLLCRAASAAVPSWRRRSKVTRSAGRPAGGSMGPDAHDLPPEIRDLRLLRHPHQLRHGRRRPAGLRRPALRAGDDRLHQAFRRLPPRRGARRLEALRRGGPQRGGAHLQAQRHRLPPEDAQAHLRGGADLGAAPGRAGRASPRSPRKSRWSSCRTR